MMRCCMLRRLFLALDKPTHTGRGRRLAQPIRGFRAMPSVQSRAGTRIHLCMRCSGVNCEAIRSSSIWRKSDHDGLKTKALCKAECDAHAWALYRDRAGWPWSCDGCFLYDAHLEMHISMAPVLCCIHIGFQIHRTFDVFDKNDLHD